MTPTTQAMSFVIQLGSTMILALSCNFLINGTAVQHQALLNRQMRFVALAVIQIGPDRVKVFSEVMKVLSGESTREK